MTIDQSNQISEKPFNNQKRIIFFPIHFIALSFLIFISGCSSSSSDDPKPTTVAPTITSFAPTSATVGVEYSYNIIASGTPAPVITVSGLPSWMGYNGSTNTISGTPTAAGTTGTITITANNGVSPNATQMFTITVSAASSAPTITSTVPTTAMVGSVYSYSILSTGNPSPTITVMGLPSWLSYNSGTKTISGTPTAAGTTGTITITANNGVSPNATQMFTITVSAAFSAPTITSTAPTTAMVGSVYTYIITTIGNPTPTITVSGLPTWLSFNSGTKTISGTPTAAGTTGTITITANNGVSPNATQTFLITVSVALVAPTITSTALSTATVGTAYSYTILSTGNPSPTITVSGLPFWLSYNSATKTISGTPTIVETTGVITIIASNGILPNSTQTFSINVSPISTAPIISSVAPTRATVGTEYSYTIVTTGFPLPSITVSGLPSWLSFDSGTKTVSGTPSTTEITGTIIVTANNGISPNATQLFVVNVVRIVYVNANATGLNNGSSWANAYCKLYNALSNSIEGDEIWVSASIYKPSDIMDRTASFNMQEGVSMYGGFNGSETCYDQRDWNAYSTYLSGDLNGNDIGFTNNSENSYHVVIGANNATIDGFIIQGGNANGSDSNLKNGGGMYNYAVNPTINNCKLFYNSAIDQGGGIYNIFNTTQLSYCIFNNNTAKNGGGMTIIYTGSSIKNCLFYNNTASTNGGGINQYNGISNLIESCSFINNSAGYNGGGVFGFSGEIVNSVFSNNISNNNGGGLVIIWSNPIITNCTFSQNTSLVSGGAMFIGVTSYPEIVNCILFGNTSPIGSEIRSEGPDCSPNFYHNCISGGLLGISNNSYATSVDLGGNINLNPLFINTTDIDGTDNLFGTEDDGLNLQLSSPCIDAGTATNAPDIDISGASRPIGSGIDMGAYEAQ